MYLALRKNFQTKSRRGFSLGEVLLAGFILTAGLLAISALMVKSLKNSFETRDTIIAVELAQEGMELVRNVRDNDLAQGGTGFTAFDNNKKHCRIDYDASDMTCATSPSSDYSLQYTSGFYKYGGSNSGRFSRYIYINNVGSGSEIKYLVRSFVYWGGGASGTFNIENAGVNGNTANCIVAKKCVYTEVNLTNWK